MIDSQNLFRLQSLLTKGEKSIPVKTLEKDYILTWILAGIARSELNNLLAFKGGTALKKFYIENYRFSEDLDFTLLKSFDLDPLKEKIEKVYEYLLNEANIQIIFNRSEIHSNSYTIFVNFSGPLGADIRRGEIKMDFTINELLLFPLERKRFFKLYKEYSDVPLNTEILVYSIEEILVEKFISLLDPKRNEPRNIYDLWILLDNGYVQIDLLKDYIIEKAKFKKLKDFNIIRALDKKKEVYKRLWIDKLNYQVLDLPYFEHVYRYLKRNLRYLI